VTAWFGATAKPLANGAPSRPGSDRSHDRKGVVSSKSTKPPGHSTRAGSGGGRVHTSVNAARMSTCATSAA
jgi:hypothetical protein